MRILNPRDFIFKTLSTFFYAGYFPLIPGTFASMVAAFIFYFIKSRAPVYILLTFFIIILGFLVSGKTERLFNKKDPRCIVIDEVGGMLLSFMFIPCDIKLIATGFFLFRLLDTLKPYPAGPLQNLRGGMGIMSDDIVAGIYTNIILQFVARIVL